MFTALYFLLLNLLKEQDCGSKYFNNSTFHSNITYNEHCSVKCTIEAASPVLSDF